MKNKLANPAVVKTLSLILAVIGVVSCMLAVNIQKQQKPYGLGDYSGYEISELETSFQETQDNNSLVSLLKALCYKVEIENDISYTNKIEKYGTMLFDRARDEKADLSKLDDEEIMLELIERIKDYGAK